jgi:hypothetical protein
MKFVLIVEHPAIGTPLPLGIHDTKMIQEESITNSYIVIASLSPCYIRKQKESLSLQVGTEYYNNTNTVRRYLFDKNSHSIEQWKDTNAIDVFVYSFSRLPKGFKSKLKKLKRLRLRKKELKWIFE